MINNTYYVFQLFQDQELLDSQAIQDIQKEWARFFIQVRSNL